MLVDVAEEEISRRTMDDDPQITAGTHRPEPLVPRRVHPMQAMTGLRGVYLQVEGRRLDRLLLVAPKATKAGGERVGDPELHGGA